MSLEPLLRKWRFIFILTSSRRGLLCSYDIHIDEWTLESWIFWYSCHRVGPSEWNIRTYTRGSDKGIYDRNVFFTVREQRTFAFINTSRLNPSTTSILANNVTCTRESTIKRLSNYLQAPDMWRAESSTDLKNLETMHFPTYVDNKCFHYLDMRK
jgi:hypothetical protein